MKAAYTHRSTQPKMPKPALVSTTTARVSVAEDLPEPPCSLEMERAVLASIIMDNTALPAVSDMLTTDDFFLPEHRRIFEQMVKMGQAGLPIDLPLLTEQLWRCDELDAAGGPAYLAAVLDGQYRRPNVEFYAAIVKQKAMLRSIMHVANDTLLAATQPHAEPTTLVAEAMRRLREVQHTDHHENESAAAGQEQPRLQEKLNVPNQFTTARIR
jgi:replicative DNA helicase